MRRTEVLQGLRRMKFEDIYGRWQQRRLSQAEAAEILGMSERTFRRWRDRYEGEGAAGLEPHRPGAGRAGLPLADVGLVPGDDRRDRPRRRRVPRDGDGARSRPLL